MTDITVTVPFRGGKRTLLFPNHGILWPYVFFEKTLSLNPDPLRVVDVGACIGGFAIPVLSRCPATLDAIEPSRKAWPYLVHNLQGIGGVTIHRVAASSSAGAMVMSAPTADAGNLFGRDGFYGDGADAESVPTARLDDLIAGRVDIMKVDVEGHELEVLHGAETVLRKWHPLLIIELKNEHQERAGHTINEVVIYLIRLGYAMPEHFGGNDYSFRWGDQ